MNCSQKNALRGQNASGFHPFTSYLLSMLKCVIFDMDGTIADTMPLCIAAFRDSIENLIGKRISDEEILETFGPAEEGTIRALLPDHYEEGVIAYLENYRKLHVKMCPEPFEGILDLLYFLKSKGIILAIVTGKGAKSLDISLDILGLKDIFDILEPGSPLGPVKPQSMETVMQTFQVKPEECVYIGDAPSDIIASRKVSVPVISVTWAQTTNLDHLKSTGPDALCQTVPELRELLERMIN